MFGTLQERLGQESGHRVEYQGAPGQEQTDEKEYDNPTDRKISQCRGHDEFEHIGQGEEQHYQDGEHEQENDGAQYHGAGKDYHLLDGREFDVLNLQFGPLQGLRDGFLDFIS